MFALTSTLVPSQIISTLTQALSSPSIYRISDKAGKRNSSKSLEKVEKATLSVKNIAEVLELYPAKENMSEVVQQCLLLQPKPSGVLTQKRFYTQFINKRSHWVESHVSSNTFEQNKMNDIHNNLSSRFLLGNTYSALLRFDNRKFRTKRGIKKEGSSALGSIFSSDADYETEPPKYSSKKLNKLLEKQPHSVQESVKVAFAEGYMAGGAEKTKTKKWYTGINVKSLLVFLVIFPAAFALYKMRDVKVNFKLNEPNEVSPEEIDVTFSDVKGAEEAKLELEEIVDFLKSPSKYTNLGAQLPKVVLLVGPPGTGKTLLARAIAGEADVPFFHASGSQFEEILVGQGARRVRDLFNNAKKRAPCVIFIDEIDSVGGKRTNSVLHPYANQTINQLLAEMDGFVQNEGVIVLGATNRRDHLDKALLRPGRFDVEVQVPIPDFNDRKKIFEYYLSKVKYSPDVDVSVLGRGTTGFTGADIKNLVNQAALRAASDQQENVPMSYFNEARDNILMGPQKKNRIPDEEANLLTAYHEGGHTVVSYYTKDSIPLHKVTIMPRGPALGHTAFIPDKEQYHITKSQMFAQMDSLMGGRAAEELIFGKEKCTSGASSDLQRATAIATSMVKNFGMSDKVGLRTFDEESDQLIKVDNNLSGTTKEAIDSEIQRLLQESYDRAKTILKDHSKELKRLAETLMEMETLDATEIKDVLEGNRPSKKL